MTPITKAIITELQVRADNVRDRIADGRCGDWTEYRAQVEKRKTYLDAIQTAIAKDRTDEDEE